MLHLKRSCGIINWIETEKKRKRKMGMIKGKKGASVWKRAFAVCRAYPGKLAALGMFHFLPRAAFALLLCMAGTAWEKAGNSAPYGLAVLLPFAAFFILWMLPSRFYLGGALRNLIENKTSSAFLPGYGIYLKAGAWRLLRGIAWGIPFLAGVSLFLYAMDLPYTELGGILQKFVLFGPVTNARGLITVMLLLLLFLLLFIWGWRRDRMMELLPVKKESIGLIIRKPGKTELLLHSMENALLCLPALAGWALVIVPYVQGNMRSSSNILRVVQSLLGLIRQTPPLEVMAGLIAVYALLYMPFFLLRRLRTALLIHE